MMPLLVVTFTIVRLNDSYLRWLCYTYLGATGSRTQSKLRVQLLALHGAHSRDDDDMSDPAGGTSSSIGGPRFNVPSERRGNWGKVHSQHVHELDKCLYGTLSNEQWVTHCFTSSCFFTSLTIFFTACTNARSRVTQLSVYTTLHSTQIKWLRWFEPLVTDITAFVSLAP